MQITLTDLGPPIWFLGEPKNLIVSLNFANPGPVELDFTKLERVHQQRVLLALQNGYLESDIPFQEIYECYTKSAPPAPKMVAPDEIASAPVANTVAATTKLLADQRLQIEAERQEKEEKIKEKCLLKLKGSVVAAVSNLVGEEDPRYLRMLISYEQQGKNRKMVIRKIRERIKRIEDGLAKKITKETEDQIAAMKSETNEMVVVESEQRTVVLTPEDLIAAGVKFSKT